MLVTVAGPACHPSGEAIGFNGSVSDDPFMAEAQKHMTAANKMGRIAFKSLLWAIGSFVVYARSDDQSWCWLFWLASVVLMVRMNFALQERWFHRGAARIALSFYEYSKVRVRSAGRHQSGY